MAHAYQNVRDDKVAKSRAKELTKGYASGGAVAAATDAKSSARKTARPSAMKVSGVAPKSRMDRPGRASGGRVKKAPQTNIHINVTPPPTSPPTVAAAPAAPMGPPGPRPVPPPMPPGGPMAGPPPGLGGPPGGIPGLPPMMRAKGGRVSAKPGPGWIESEKNKTPVQHLPGKNDLKELGRGKPITYASGGPINAPAKGGMGPKLGGGGRGGTARLAKAARAKSKRSG